MKEKRPHIDGHAGDADAVSTISSAGSNSPGFVVLSEVAEGAPLMAVPLGGQEPETDVRYL